MTRLVRSKPAGGALPMKGGGRASIEAAGAYQAVGGQQVVASTVRLPRNLEAKGSDVAITFGMPRRALQSPVTPGMLDRAIDDPNYRLLIAEVAGVRIVDKVSRPDGTYSAIVLETQDHERIVDAGSYLVVANSHRPDSMARRVARIVIAKGFPSSTVATAQGATLVSSIAREIKRIGCLSHPPTSGDTLLAQMDSADRSSDAVFAPDVEMAAIDLIAGWFQRNAPSWISTDGFAKHPAKILTLAMALPSTDFEMEKHREFLSMFEMGRDAQLKPKSPTSMGPA